MRGLLDGSTLPAGLPVDADLRWACWVALAAQDAASPAELDAALAADDTMTGRRAHLLAVASRPGAAAREATWQRATTDESVTNDQLRALVRGFAQPADPPAPGYAERYFASLTGWWAGAHPDHGHDPRPRAVPRRVARRGRAARAAPGRPAGPRLAARTTTTPRMRCGAS